MSLRPLPVPPGFYRPATRSQAAGRYYGGTLVRWVDGILQAIGGWEPMPNYADVDIVPRRRKLGRVRGFPRSRTVREARE